MKLLMISLDRAILTAHSPQQDKVFRYGAALTELHIILFCFGKRLPRRIMLAPAIFVYPTNHWFCYNPFYFWRAFRIALRVARLHGFDARRDSITAQDAFVTGIVGYAAKAALGLPLQIQVHIDFFNPRFRKESFLHELYFRFACFLLPRADTVRVVSPSIGDYCVHILHIRPEKITVLPVCADIRKIADSSPAFDLRAQYPPHSFIALILCRFVWQKNVDCALRALRIIFTDYPRAILVIAGSGPEEGHLRNSARKLAIAERIFFVPWTHDTVSYYKGADAFLFLSRYEGWGLAVLEAMAAGLTVLATPVGCVPEFIESGTNGFVVRDDSAEDVAQALRTLMRDPERRAHMGAAARVTVFERLPAMQSYIASYIKAIRHVS